MKLYTNLILVSVALLLPFILGYNARKVIVKNAQAVMDEVRREPLPPDYRILSNGEKFRWVKTKLDRPAGVLRVNTFMGDEYGSAREAINDAYDNEMRAIKLMWNYEDESRQWRDINPKPVTNFVERVIERPAPPKDPWELWPVPMPHIVPGTNYYITNEPSPFKFVEPPTITLVPTNGITIYTNENHIILSNSLPNYSTLEYYIPTNNIRYGGAQ